MSEKEETGGKEVSEKEMNEKEERDGKEVIKREKEGK